MIYCKNKEQYVHLCIYNRIKNVLNKKKNSKLVPLLHSSCYVCIFHALSATTVIKHSTLQSESYFQLNSEKNTKHFPFSQGKVDIYSRKLSFKTVLTAKLVDGLYLNLVYTCIHRGFSDVRGHIVTNRKKKNYFNLYRLNEVIHQSYFPFCSC